MELIFSNCVEYNGPESGKPHSLFREKGASFNQNFIYISSNMLTMLIWKSQNYL